MDPKFIQDFDYILVYQDPGVVPEVYTPAEVLAYYSWILEGVSLTDFDDHYNRHILVVDCSNSE